MSNLLGNTNTGFLMARLKYSKFMDNGQMFEYSLAARFSLLCFSIKHKLI